MEFLPEDFLVRDSIRQVFNDHINYIADVILKKEICYKSLPGNTELVYSQDVYGVIEQVIDVAKLGITDYEMDYFLYYLEKTCSFRECLNSGYVTEISSGVYKITPQNVKYNFSERKEISHDNVSCNKQIG